jgi:nucleoside-diphosphate-sugar epimerase
MRVLVTGHKGYVGTVLVRLLVDAGHAVTGLDSDLYAASTYGDPARIVAVPEIRKDIRDVLAFDLDGYDAVLHLAGLSNDPLGDLNPELTYEINHLASARLARLARQAGVARFVFSSSCSNYGAAGDDWIDEDSAFNPVTAYGISKVRAEQDIARMADDAFTPVFLRSATAYGVSPRLRFDLVLNNLVAWAYTTGRVFLKSDGSAWRPIVHVEDMARAFVAVLEAPRDAVHNQGFNVGRTGENYRIRDLAEIVRATVPGSAVEFADGASPDKRCYRVNCDRLPTAVPGFQPAWDARRGAEQLYAAYQASGLTLEEFEGERYKRVAHIKHLLDAGRLDANLRWRGGDLPAPLAAPRQTIGATA